MFETRKASYYCAISAIRVQYLCTCCAGAEDASTLSRKLLAADGVFDRLGDLVGAAVQAVLSPALTQQVFGCKLNAFSGVSVSGRGTCTNLSTAQLVPNQLVASL